MYYSVDCGMEACFSKEVAGPRQAEVRRRLKQSKEMSAAAALTAKIETEYDKIGGGEGRGER